MTGPPVTGAPHASPIAGVEWLVEALGCDAVRLRDLAAVRGVCDAVLAGLGLCRLGDGLWHAFPEPGGVTGLVLLAESHLACHTYPEHGLATFNLYCCRPRPRWPWEDRLRESLGAASVVVRSVPRGGEAGR